MDQPREVVFHQSANRPTLFLGCDRQLILWAAFFAVLMWFSLMSLTGAFVAIVFWLITVAVLRRMGKADPILREATRKAQRRAHVEQMRRASENFGAHFLNC